MGLEDGVGRVLGVSSRDARMKVVSPYRPFAPESGPHQALGAFDWIAALRMLAISVRRTCACETYALTDVDTSLPVSTIQVQTSERRLMRWILEVSLRYLESSAFDQDTVFISPDTIVMEDLRAYFAGDLGLLVRPASKYKMKPVLNSIQWWPVASREKLIAFYRAALEMATELPSGYLRWGADCEVLKRLIAPVAVGRHMRAGLTVAMYDAHAVLYSITAQTTRRLKAERHAWWPPGRPVIDFKGRRKHFMAPFFQRAQAQRWAV